MIDFRTQHSDNVLTQTKDSTTDGRTIQHSRSHTVSKVYKEKITYSV